MGTNKLKMNSSDEVAFWEIMCRAYLQLEFWHSFTEMQGTTNLSNGLVDRLELWNREEWWNMRFSKSELSNSQHFIYADKMEAFLQLELLLGFTEVQVIAVWCGGISFRQTSIMRLQSVIKHEIKQDSMSWSEKIKRTWLLLRVNVYSDKFGNFTCSIILLLRLKVLPFMKPMHSKSSLLCI